MPDTIKPKPMNLYSDLDLKGNELRRAYISTPEKDNDPANKAYIDGQIILDTENAQKFDKPLVEVGGLTKDTKVYKKHIKNILDDMLFPVIPPVYKESEINIKSEPIKFLIGIPGQHQVWADIIPNDRQYPLTNITCRTIPPIGQELTYVSPRNGETSNIRCLFNAGTVIDTKCSTILQLEVVMSPAKSKYDNHGNISPNILFESQRNIIKKLSYHGVYPVFYSIKDTTSNQPFNYNEPVSWDNLLENFEFFDPINYQDSFNSTSVDFVVGTDKPKSILMYVPIECLRFDVDDENLLSCCDTYSHRLIPTGSSEAVTYVAIAFTTGDYQYEKNKTIKVTFKSEGIVFKDKIVISDYVSGNGHTIIDDNQVEYEHQDRLHITNAKVENKWDQDTTVVHVHPENAPVDGGFYDQ